MTEVYFNWEPAGQTDLGTKVVSRILVDGKAVEYPKIEVVQSEDAKNFLCVFSPVEGVEYCMTADNWEFTNQTLQMWAMRVIFSHADPDAKLMSLDNINISELIAHLEDSLKQEDQDNESD